MEPSVNMTRTSLPYISIVFFTIVLRCESLSDICNIHKKAIQKKTCSQRSSCRFSCTFCAYFVNLYNKPLVWKRCTDHDYKGWKTSSIVSYQMKAECEMFSFFSSFKAVGLIGAFYGPSLRSPTLPYIRYSVRTLYYYMRNFSNLFGLEQWYFSLIWNTYM